MWWDQYEDPAEAAAQAAKEAEASAKHRNFLAQQVAVGESWAGVALKPWTIPLHTKFYFIWEVKC